MDALGSDASIKAEDFQDSVIRENISITRANLVKEVTAIRDAVKIKASSADGVATLRQMFGTSSDADPADLFEKINVFFDHYMIPSRLDRLATFHAEHQYREQVHKQYFQAQQSSNTEHAVAISLAIADREPLCSICRSAAEKISAFLLAFDDGQEEKPKVDEFWPPRPMDRAAYFDGQRLIPPEDIRLEGFLPQNVVQHHKMAQDMVSSANTCPLCELLRIACIIDSFRERGQPFDHSREPLSKILESIRRGRGSPLFNRILGHLSSSEEPLYLMLWKERNSDRPQEKANLSFKLGHIQLIWKRPATDMTEKERKVVYTRLQEFPRLAPYISHREPLRSSESSDAINLLRAWFQSCQINHPNCRKTIFRETIDPSDRHELPRRLLDLGAFGSDCEPCLVDTSGYPNGQWVALSHCWGDTQKHPLKTTRDNLTNHMRGIPLSSMPKTFLHAVLLTRMLKVRYLWIDSLCIVQNDEVEWFAESQNMGDIYERAVLTLAASSAEDSTQGLFLQRDYARLQAPCAQLPFVRKSSTKSKESLGSYKIGIEWRQEPLMKALDPMDTALSTRGWATQEWILSRRIIHSLDRGMVWVCNSWAEDETGHSIIGRNLPCGEWVTQWARIIQEHSARKFTRQSDRLISLEGLARKFKKLKPLSRFYSFGTWESDLPEHLLWSPKMLGGKLTDLPSWSWASCPYAVWFRIRDITEHQDCAYFWPTCTVLGVDETTGRLSINSKRIEMSPYLTQKFDPDDPSADFADLRGRANHWSGRYISVPSRSTPVGWTLFDDGRENINSTEPIFFLSLAAISFYVSPLFELYGLLITRHPSDKNGYVRIGVAAISDFDWMADVPLVDVDTDVI